MGAGGAIFVQAGGTLTYRGGTVSGGSVIAGRGANSGRAYGSGIFIQGNQSVTFAPSAGETLRVGNVIADLTGSKDASGQTGAGNVVVSGAGTVVLSAANTYTGGTTVRAGTLQLAQATAAGAGPITLNSGGTVEFTGAASGGENVAFGGAGTVRIDAGNQFGTIFDFTASGEVVDLPNLSDAGNDAEVFFNSFTNQLGVFGDNNGIVVLQLDAENYSGVSWAATPDAVGGTMVTAGAPPLIPPAPTSQDFNGDRRADFVFQTSDNRFFTALSNGVSYSAPQQWGTEGGGPITGEAQYTDVNGDGKADLVYQGQDNRFWLSTSTGSGFGPAQLVAQEGGTFVPGEAQYADVNHDGDADLIYQGLDNRFWLSLSTGSGFGPARLVAQEGGAFVDGEAQYADLSGNGKADLIYQGLDNRFWLSASTGSGFGAAQLVAQEGGTFVAGEAQYADVTGHGRSDLIYQGLDNRFWVSPSTGIGFTTPQLWADLSSISPNFQAGDAQYADANGDGKMDLFFQGLDNKEYLCLSTGTGFSAPQQIADFGGTFQAGQLHV